MTIAKAEVAVAVMIGALTTTGGARTKHVACKMTAGVIPTPAAKATMPLRLIATVAAAGAVGTGIEGTQDPRRGVFLLY